MFRFVIPNLGKPESKRDHEETRRLTKFHEDGHHPLCFFVTSSWTLWSIFLRNLQPFPSLGTKLGAVLRSARRQHMFRQVVWRALLIATFCFMPMSTFAQAEGQTNFAKPVGQSTPDVLVQKPFVEQTDALFAPGEIVVGFHADRVMAASTRQNLPVQFASEVAACPVSSVNGATVERQNSEAIIVQRFLTPVGQEWAVINQLRADPAVAYAEPNWVVRAADWPIQFEQNDGDTGGSTGLPQNSLVEASIETPFLANDQYYDQQWYLQRANASRAWALAEAAGITASSAAPVRVAIIDSGIDASHPDLQGRIVASQNYVTPGAEAKDDFGHGTHVAGLIGATINNSIGIAGLAPNVTYDIRKVLDNKGGGTVTNVVQGIKDATDAGARIINLSLQIDSPDTTLYNCIKYAYDNGVLLIAAAGNYNSLYPNIVHVQWPGAYDEVMAVSSTGYDDTAASYNLSGCQPSSDPTQRCGIEIAASGGSTGHLLISTWPTNLGCNSPTPAGYCTRQGTSMAAAVVSGAAALVWSIAPALTAEELRALLKQTAASVPGDAEVIGAGRLDALAAVRLALPGDFKVTNDLVTTPLQPGSAPFTTTIRMDNSSLIPVAWQAALTPTSWLTPTAKLNGAVRYGHPAHITLAISPTHLATGRYSAPLQLVATLANAERLTTTLNIGVTVGEKFSQFFFPIVAHEGASASAVETIASFTWESDSQNNRRNLGTFNSSQTVTLPFTITLPNGQQVNDGRLYADGFLELPNPASGEANRIFQPNECLPTPAWTEQQEQSTLKWPQQAIFGWWADLDTSVAGARVSTFQPGSNRVVFEFSGVQIVESGADLSFQMVLYDSGRVDLNYLRTPSTLLANADATVGVSLEDSRFYNQVGCKDDTHEIGILPQSGQSLIFELADIY